MLERLRSDQRVALVEPLQDYTVRTVARIRTPASRRATTRMDITAAHRLSRGRGVRIALIDTGLDSDHPELRGRVDVQRNFVDADAQRFQLDRHGTAIAGIIAANADNGVGIVGIAPEARLLALKACWQLQPGRDDARCNSYTLAQALSAAIELKARVINLSLSGPPDPLLSALARQAVRAGIIIVGSQSDGPSFPGSLEHVLSVGRSEDAVVASGVLQAPGREVLTLAPERALRFLLRQFHLDRRDIGRHRAHARPAIGSRCRPGPGAAQQGDRDDRVAGGTGTVGQCLHGAGRPDGHRLRLQGRSSGRRRQYGPRAK